MGPPKTEATKREKGRAILWFANTAAAVRVSARANGGERSHHEGLGLVAHRIGRALKSSREISDTPGTTSMIPALREKEGA
jgi:hypothetical protein